MDKHYSETVMKRFWGKGKLKILFLSVLLLVVFFLSVTFFSIVLFGSLKGSKLNNNGTPRYRYLEFDEKNQEITRGFISAKSNKITHGGYMSFRDEKEKHVLISQFGTNEYVCTGLCSCEQEYQTRKSLASPILRSMTYLLAAGTSIGAMELARKYFNDQCVHQLRSECPTSSIRSDVAKCMTTTADVSEDDDEDGDEEVYGRERGGGYFDEDIEDDYKELEWDERFPPEPKFDVKDFDKEGYPREVDDDEIGKYFTPMGEEYDLETDPYKYFRCSGKCLPSKIWDDEEFDVKKMIDTAVDYKCEKIDLELTTRVDFDSHDFGPEDYEGQPVTIAYQARGYDDVAKIKFMTQELEIYCDQKSLDDDILGKGYVGHWCVGHNKNFNNPSVSCVPIEESEFVGDWEPGLKDYPDDDFEATDFGPEDSTFDLDFDVNEFD